jgi:ABC-2 type transport system ATP-binding protein
MTVAAAGAQTSSAGWAIDLTHVDKMYRGRVHALRGIDMQVRKGEIFGLLGPNGAGKSTLVKILMTVISPTRADGTVLGERVGHKPTLRRIGYLPEHHRFPDYLTGRQVVEFYGAMADVPRRERKQRAGELLEFVGMKDWANTRVRGYSKGMRQRIGIAQALVNKPDLVVLDEPTDGVDPVGRREIRTMLQALRDTGVTVFLNSHLLSELEQVCDRVAILVQGRVSAQGSISELTSHRRVYEIDIGVTPARTAELGAGLPAGVVAALAAAGVKVATDQSTIRLTTNDAVLVQPVIDHLRASGVVIQAVRPSRPSLEDLFMEAVTDPSTGKQFNPGADRSVA